MRISSRRLALAAVLAGGVMLGGATPAMAQEGPLDPVLDPVLGLLGLDQDESGGSSVPVDHGKKDDGKKDDGKKGEGKKGEAKKGEAKKGVGKGKDKGAAPAGGVETGGGGTADQGYELVLPLSLAGGAALTSGAVVLVRRRMRGQAD